MTGSDLERYSYAIDPHGNATANKVLRLVGSEKRVLELGCGPGSMTRFMRQRLDCRITAVEFDAEQAEQARPYCERLLVADLENLDFAAEFADQRFDVVVAADVLEHLRDPWRVLRTVRELLHSGGFLVVSIPNIAHNVIIAQLLAGRFPYVDKGLLDHTHLRFFTRNDVEDLLLSTGFLPETWERNLTPEESTEFAHVWLQTPAAVRDALAHSADGQTYQFIVKAYPSEEAGWIAKTRSERSDREADYERQKKELKDIKVQLTDYQKAFAEARQIIDDKEKALTDYAQAFAEARDQLEARVAELDTVNRAFNEARETLTRLDADNRALRRDNQALRRGRLRRWLDGGLRRLRPGR